MIPVVQDINQKVAKLETKVEEHSKLLEKQQERNDIQTELNTLLKMQIDVNKEQNIQMGKFGETLDRVNENLTNLNASQQQMKIEVTEISERVEDIEKKQEENKIDPIKVFKGILSYVATGIGSVAIAYVIYMLTGK